MSSFTTPLVVRPLTAEELVGRGLLRGWELQKRFSYDIGCCDGSDKITVPKCYITNFASVPRLFWFIFPPWHPHYGKAAVIHDYLYQTKVYSRRLTDAVFYDAMIALKCPRLKAEILYYAVHFFGGRAWRQASLR